MITKHVHVGDDIMICIKLLYGFKEFLQSGSEILYGIYSYISLSHLTNTSGGVILYSISDNMLYT